MALGDHSLSLGGLGKAVGANGDTTSETALAADGRGSTGTETSLSDFHTDKHGSNLSPSSWTGNPSLFSDDNKIFTYQFTNNGSLFLTRIADRPQNFNWSENVYEDIFTISSGDYTALGTARFTIIEREGTLTGVFNDSFNYSLNQTQTAAITVT